MEQITAPLPALFLLDSKPDQEGTVDIRKWIAEACKACFPPFTGEQLDAYEGASAFLDWLDTLPVCPER